MNEPQLSENLPTGRLRAALSGWPMIIGWLAMLIFAFHACTHMVAAGDTWVAMACGRHFVNQGVDTVEPFSANSHKAGPTEEEIETWPGWARWITDKVGIETVKKWHPTGWVNQNWLTHVIFYSLIPKASYADGVSFPSNALVYWKFAIYIITVICVFYAGVLMGVNPALSAVFSCFAMFIGRSFLDVRPAGFSNLCVAVFLLILVLTTYRNVLYIWLIVPLAAFWCNVHGGYIYVFIMMIPFIGLHLLGSLDRKVTAILYNIAAWPVALIVVTKSTFSLATVLFIVLVIAIDILLIFFKDRLVTIRPRGIYHLIGAYVATILATIIFNPFHLTNLTHTFVISVSEHAKRWRDIHEWHPAFEWSNPVGTGFPFLVMVILSISLFGLWFFSRFFEPAVLKGSKGVIQAQEKHFNLLYMTFGVAASIFLCWVVLIAFSLLSLDALSFFLSALFVLILLLSIHVNIHYVYLAGILALLAVWSGKGDAGYSGRYIYPFVIIPTYVMLHSFARLFPKSPARKHINILFVVVPAVVSLLLMIVLIDPFKFTHLFDAGWQSERQLDTRLVSNELRRKFDNYDAPLSDDAAITVEELGGKWLIIDGSKKYSIRKEGAKLNVYILESPLWHMDRLIDLKRIWRPNYEGSAKLGYSLLFPALYIINLISILLWLVPDDLRNARRGADLDAPLDVSPDGYEPPKIDLPHTIIVGLTIYMAIRSRRFIPIAGIVACPIIAMFISQIIHTTSAVRNFYGRNLLGVSRMSQPQRFYCIVIGATAVVFFGTWWGLRFKQVYLDPWPNDPKLSSVFMRMTASDAKPFYVTKFMKMNRMEGKMFNYWTEGGAIAFGQEPDPNTGHTPLQLFMDGRAQAAYNRHTFDLWTAITSGGPTVQAAAREAGALGKSLDAVLTAADYRKVGLWLAAELKKYGVWAALMPAGQFAKPFTRGLEYSQDWVIVFFNNKQKLFVDISTPQGRKLFQGISTGQTLYPDEYHKNLVLGRHLLVQPDTSNRQRGFDLIKKAFNENPSPAPMLEVMLVAARHAELTDQITKFLTDWVNNFAQKQEDYRARNGYRLRLEATRLACVHLEKTARAQKNTKLANSYKDRMKQYIVERNRLSQTKRW